jgi:KDO2-lipid IV(A) lauroyltransferase
VSGEPDAYPLSAYWSPRYWPVWIFWAWLKLMAALPFPRQIRIGKKLGRLLMPLLGRHRLAAERNIALCFPELDDAARRDLVVSHFEAYGASLSEMALGWNASNDTIEAIVRVEGRKNLDAALARGRGVLLFMAHFTCLEVGVAILEQLCTNCGCMYRPQRNAMFDTLILKGRSRFARQQIDKNNVRGLLRALKDNMAIAYLPDHAYVGSQSALLPFFGEPALTNTATSKLAELSGAAVVPYFFRRVDDDSGYVVEILPAMENFPSGDTAADTQRLVALLEGYIRRSPEQYLWTYRRFKGRGPGYPDVYARPS